MVMPSPLRPTDEREALFDDGDDNPSAVTRDYHLEVDAPDDAAPLLSVFGGKITTYRRLAEHALEKLGPHLPRPGATWTADAPLPGGDPLIVDDAEPGGPAAIFYTSGTTGFPKGATLSHHSILNNGYFVGRICGLTPEDRVCIPVPFYHCFGMVLGNLACTTHGSAIVIPEAGFEPGATLAAVAA